MKKTTKLIIINGVEIPACDEGLEIVETVFVDGGRNANGTVVGQKIGRTQWKINNLQWSGLTVEEWKTIKDALAPFYVKVQFTDDTNKRHNLTMYPGDKTGIPMPEVVGTSYKRFSSCKFNLIDCGKQGED